MAPISPRVSQHLPHIKLSPNSIHLRKTRQPLALATESWLSWASGLPLPPLTTFWSLFCCTHQGRPSSGCCTGSSICLVPLFEPFWFLLVLPVSVHLFRKAQSNVFSPGPFLFISFTSLSPIKHFVRRTKNILFFVPFPSVSTTRVSAPRGQRLRFRAESTARAPYSALKE